MFLEKKGTFEGLLRLRKKGCGASRRLRLILSKINSMKSIQRLQEKWKVGQVQFWLIILTFALGGSLSGRLCSYLLKLVFLEKNWAFWLVYPLFLTILWPFSVIFVSFFTGQFRFFKGYLGRVGARLLGSGLATDGHSGEYAAPSTASAAPIHIAIFASGAGSNARKIIEYFENKAAGTSSSLNSLGSKVASIKISLIVCNVPGAGVLDIAEEKGIPSLMINKSDFAANGYVESLKNAGIDFIVLAGFLWKVPEVLVKAYPKAIINIHPALLPKYGGKGMYGARVHEAVIAAGEKQSGITIHWVNEHYDEGAIIYQANCPIDAGETPATLAHKIHALEHAHFAPTIEKLLN
jgi:folate-dependent phosphoribosylglycinamide formyltransferase PurN